MIDGAMQEFALTLDKFLDHAAKWHPRAEVVTAREGDRADRVRYAELRERSMRISSMLRDFEVGPGDRVATLAWNTQVHVETWYGIVGIGAACHTLNPRLTAAETAAMLVRSECRILVVSADLAPLAQQIVELAPAIERVLIIDGSIDSWSGVHSRLAVIALEDAMNE